MEIQCSAGHGIYKVEPASPQPMILAVTPFESFRTASSSSFLRKHGAGDQKTQKKIQLPPPPPRVCRKGRNKKRKTTNKPKGQYWTLAEDRLLTRLVNMYGEKQWSILAKVFNRRTGKQCRERWHNHLRPDIKRDTWTEEEDMIIIQAHSEIGNRWAEIARRIPGRTENSIKNRWNATRRKRQSRHPRSDGSNSTGRSSLLQDYIMSLNQSESSSTAAPAIAAAKPIQSLAKPMNTSYGFVNPHNVVSEMGSFLKETGSVTNWEEPFSACYEFGGVEDAFLHERALCRGCSENAGLFLQGEYPFLQGSPGGFDVGWSRRFSSGMWAAGGSMRDLKVLPDLQLQTPSDPSTESEMVEMIMQAGWSAHNRGGGSSSSSGAGGNKFHL